MIRKIRKILTIGARSLSCNNFPTGGNIFKIKIGGRLRDSLNECAGAVRLGEQ